MGVQLSTILLVKIVIDIEPQFLYTVSMLIFDVETTFSKVEVGQLFEVGEGFGRVTYKKRDKSTANPAFGQEYQVYSFNSNRKVKVQKTS